MKKGKTSKLNVFDDAKCFYGTVDSKNLKSIYVVLQTWIEPLNVRLITAYANGPVSHLAGSPVNKYSLPGHCATSFVVSITVQ